MDTRWGALAVSGLDDRAAQAGTLGDMPRCDRLHLTMISPAGDGRGRADESGNAAAGASESTTTVAYPGAAVMARELIAGATAKHGAANAARNGHGYRA